MPSSGLAAECRQATGIDIEITTLTNSYLCISGLTKLYKT